MESMKNSDWEGFLGVVGKLDGTDIVLKFKPGGIFKGEIFFNRKKRQAVDLCTLCDSSKRFTYILAGWPNSQHDAQSFVSTSIHRNPRRYFSPGEYFLGDSAYSNTSYSIGPYKSPYIKDISDRKFNQKLSSVRVDIEHAFGILKGRWESLIGLRLMIWSREKYKLAVKWITACWVLHNILVDLKDDWDRKEDWWTAEEISGHNQELLAMSQSEESAGMIKREIIKEMVLKEQVDSD